MSQNNEKKGYKVSRIETISNRFVDFEKVGYVDIDLNISEYLIRKGDILFSHINSVKHIGKVAQFSSDEELYHGMNLLLLRFNKKVNNRYGYYYLSSYKFKSYCERLCKQAVNQASLNQKDVNQIPILLPTFPEQHNIAETLSTVDADIEKTDDIIKETQRLKKGLMKKLFTEGIGHTRFKKTKIGRMPEEWLVKKFTKLIQLKHGYQFRDYDFVETGIPVIKIANLKNGSGLNMIDLSFISHHRAREFEDKKIFKDDILMALTGATLGKVCRVDDDYGIILQNYRVGKFLPTADAIFHDFIYYLLQSKKFQNEMFRFINEGAQPNVGKADFDKIYIQLPSKKEQMKIVEILKEIDSKIENERATKSELEQLKKGLLQVLLTGKVRVKV